MNKKLLFSIPLVLLLTGCNIKNKDNVSVSNREDSSSPESESSSSSSSSVSPSTLSYTFNFKEVGFNDGTNVSNKATEFLQFLNKDEEIVTSVSSDNCFYHGTGSSGTPTSLEIGTGSYAGSITFNFKYEVSKITFSIQGHHKWNSHDSIWSLDADSQITVEGQTFNVGSVDTSKEPEIEEHEITIASPHKEIIFSNNGDHQRTFLHSLTIEYTA